MVIPTMDRNRGRPSHQRESRFDSNRHRKQDTGKRDSGRQKQDEDKKPDIKTEPNENGAERGERKGQKIIVDAETGQKKFTGRCRLFVGNIPSDTKEDDFKEMFKQYGESSEIFLNPSRGFGFIRLVSAWMFTICKGNPKQFEKNFFGLILIYLIHSNAFVYFYFLGHKGTRRKSQSSTRWVSKEGTYIESQICHSRSSLESEVSTITCIQRTVRRSIHPVWRCRASCSDCR